MNPVDWVILGAVLLAVAGAIAFAVRRKKRGCCCGSDCACCGACAKNCESVQKKADK